MKIYNQILMVVILVCLTKMTFSQATIPGNLRPPAPGPFLGWNNLGAAGPLDIRNDFVPGQPIDIFTNNTQRMVITGGGNVGLGNFTNPQSRLHLHSPGGNDTWFQVSTNGSVIGGLAGTDGLRIGLIHATQQVNINQQEDASIDIFTNAGVNNTRKMRIWHDAANLPRVAIGNINPPLTYLHIGEDAFAGTGWRAWMNLGVLMHQRWDPVTGNAIHDNMYVGLRRMGNDLNDAIINWGNNPVASGDDDRLRFIFTAEAAAGVAASGANGLEIARMTSDGTFGRMGIGDFFTAGADPASLLHLHENSFTGTAADDVWLQLTTNTGAVPLAADGLRIGVIRNPGNAEINQQENAALRFLTNTTPRMEIVNNGRVGVGNYLAFTYQSAKLQVHDPDENDAILGINTNTSLTGGVHAGVHGQSIGSRTGAGLYNIGGWFNADSSQGPNANSPAFNIGVDASAVYPCSTCWNYGGYFYARRSDLVNFGIFAEANDLTLPGVGENYGGWFVGGGALYNYGISARVTSATANNYGGYFIANNGTTENIGVKTSAAGGSTVNYGIHASGGTTCDSVPTPSNCTDAAGFFSGAVGVTDHLYDASDLILKDNIQPMTNASSILNQLNPVTFNFKTQDFPSMHFGSQNNFGFIAQEIQLIIPELIRHFTEPAVKDTSGNIVYDKVDYLGLDYISIIPILVKGHQEQQQIIDTQQQIIDSLQQAIALLGLKSTGSATPNQHTIELKSEEAILYQNQPNPFDNSTVIRYFIPENTGTVKIIFNDNTGKSINEIVISEKSEGSLQVNAQQLNSGIYTYSLMIDGKVIDSKKMLKAK